jgi:hypothetical protein
VKGCHPLDSKKVDPKSKADPLAFTSRRFHSETTFTRWTVNDEDNDRLEGLPRAARRGGEPQQIADGYGTLLQVEEAKYKKPLEKQVSELSALQQVLVVRVHPDLLRSQGLSEELRNEKTIWGERRRARSSRWF